MPKAGIHEVAARARVSVTAVSFAMNGRGNLSTATRNRILRAADELGYRPHHVARSLATGRSRAVALQVSSGDDRGAVVPRDALSTFYIEALNGAAAEALALDHLLVMVPGTAPREDFTSLPVDAAVVVDPVGPQRLGEFLHREARPVVSIGHHLQQPDLFDAVIDNDFDAVIATCVSHLLDRGYERPALMIGPSQASYSHDLLAAYKSWCRKQRRRPIVANMAGQVYLAALAAALNLLGPRRKGRPDCIIAVSDETGLGTVQAARELGLKVPDDLGVLTLTSTAPTLASQLATPSLSLVSLHAEQQGRAAIQTAVALLEGGKQTTKPRLVVEHSLIVGDSTARDC
jgi:DNA-binding LacI/PurR family transcriptional regulator